MAQELSYEQIEDFMSGPKAPSTVRFYDYPRLDSRKSHQAGRRVYVDTLYIEIRVKGVRDFVAHPASQEEIRKHPREYQEYLDKKDKHSAMPIGNLPTMVPMHEKELLAMGIANIEDLVGRADTLPADYHPYVRMARAIMDSMEESDAPVPSGPEHGGVQEGQGSASFGSEIEGHGTGPEEEIFPREEEIFPQSQVVNGDFELTFVGTVPLR